MIVTFILTMLANFINFLLDHWLVASSELPIQISTSFQYLMDRVHGLNKILPVDTALLIFRISITILIAEFFFTLVNFVINKVRGSGAGG